MNFKLLHKDINYGKEKEDEKLELIRKLFGEKIKKIKEKYFVFDYGCEDCYVELKSRRCSSTQYNDTMVGKNKVDYAEHTKRPVYFCFNFTDGMYYWKYDKKDIEDGNVYFKRGGRYDRGMVEESDYAYIKKNVLVKV
jgi:hypothetical protein